MASPSESDSESDYLSTDYSSSEANTPAPRATIRGGAEVLDVKDHGLHAGGRHAALNDEQLQSKLRSAQERLEGLDKHVISLKEKAAQQDAIARGKLPPEQTAAYTARVKELETKRRHLLKMQMEQNENLQAVATKNGTLNAHRHGGTPRADREANRRDMIERVQRESEAATARLGALRGGSKLPEAEEAHRRALEASIRAEAEHRAAEDQRQLAGRRGEREEREDRGGLRGGAPDVPPLRHQRGDAIRQSADMQHANDWDRERNDAHRRGHDNGHNNNGHDGDWNHHHNMHETPRGNHPPNGPWGTPGGYPPGPMGPGPGGGGGYPGYPPPYGGYPPYGGHHPGMYGGGPYGMHGNPMDPYGMMGGGHHGGRGRSSDGRRAQTPDYASSLRRQVKELQEQLGDMLVAVKKTAAGGGGGGGGGGKGNVHEMPELPKEVANDKDIKQLYEAHLKEMLKLQLEIGRESRVVELERLRTEMLQLKDGIVPGQHQQQQHQQQQPPQQQYYQQQQQPPPWQAQPWQQQQQQQPWQQQQQQGYPSQMRASQDHMFPPPDAAEHMAMEQEMEGHGPGVPIRVSETPGLDPGMDQTPGVDAPAPPSGQSKRTAKSKRSALSGKDKRALTPVEEGKEDAKSDYSITSGSEYSDSYSDDDSYYSDDSEARERNRQGLGRDQPRYVIRVMLEGAGPMDLKNAPARIVAAAYEGYEPARDASGAPVRSRGPLLEPSSHDRGGAARYKWRARIALRGVNVTAATKLVLELHAATPVKGMGADIYGHEAVVGPEEVVAWAHIPVLGPEGVPLSGLQVSPLLQLPLMLSADRTMRIEGSKVEVRVWVEEEDYDKDPTPPGTPMVAGAIVAGAPRGLSAGMGGDGAPAWLGGGGATALENEASKKEDIPGVPRRAWREVRHIGAGKGEPYQPGDGLVLCVDAARFLPPNVTITRVVGRVISAAGEPLAPEFIIHARLDSLAFSPRYHARQRFATGRWNNATAHALLQLETIEKGTSQQRTVGYVVFPFFIDPETGEPPQSTGAKGYRLREGGYQCQVYAASEGAGSGFDLREVVSRPKIPCASVLIRNLVATRADMPANKAVPQYEDGAYDSSSMYPTAVERRLYAHRLANPGPPVREVMLDLARLTFSPSVLAGMTEPDLERWMAKRLERPQFANDRPLNYRRSDVYAAELGFHVAIDGASRLTKTAFHVATQSLFPPGTFYANKASDDVVFTQQPDMASSLDAPVWRDGFQSRQHVMHEPNMVVVIDVRALSGRTAQAQGWTLLPVFEEGTEYLASGAFQLPLFQGPVQLPLLQDLVKSQAEGKGVVDTISGWLDSKKVKFTPDKASVYVRLLEDQRLGMLPEPAGPNTAGVTFPPYVGEKLEPAFLKKAAGKPYAKAIPRGSTSEDFVTENNALMAAAMGLPFIRGAAGFGAGGDELSDDDYSDVYTQQTGDYTQAS